MNTTIARLHYEINEFCQFMAPTPQEDDMRRSVVDKVREVVVNKWCNAKLEIYGSFATGFHLPTSDIDCVIIGDWIKPPLHELQEILLSAEICKPDKILLIDKATVPIIKFTHETTGIKVDISFNMESGLKSIDLIKQYSMAYPPLKKLVIVLKQYLLEKNLNEVFHGGINSYSLILMVISFLQLHFQVDARYGNCNLAILLVEFFELYGCQFNYLKTAISIKGEGTYISKEKAQIDFPPSILCIEDPLTPGNDIGRGCYGVMNVKTAFEQAYITLNQISNPLSSIVYNNKSILGKIINAMDNGILDKRKLLHEPYIQYSQQQHHTTVLYAHPYPPTNYNSSDNISNSSSPSDSDCEYQPQEFITYTPTPTSISQQHHSVQIQQLFNPIQVTMNNQTQQIKDNTMLQQQQQNHQILIDNNAIQQSNNAIQQTNNVRGNENNKQQISSNNPSSTNTTPTTTNNIIISQQQNHQQHQLKENTLLQNQIKQDQNNQHNNNGGIIKDNKNNTSLLVTITNGQKENSNLTSSTTTTTPSPIVPAKENIIIQPQQQQQQQKENMQQQQQTQHLQNTTNNNHKLYNTLPQSRHSNNNNSDISYRYNNNNRYNNKNDYYSDDSRIHQYNNTRTKYFPSTSNNTNTNNCLMDDNLTLSHHSSHHHSLPFINNSIQYPSMTFENTRNNHNNTRSHKSTLSNNNHHHYHKKANSFQGF